MWYSVILLHAAVVAARTTIWKKELLKVTQILLHKEVEVDVYSELVCAMIASAKDPPVAYCHDEPKWRIARGSYKTNQNVGVVNWECKYRKFDVCSVSIYIKMSYCIVYSTI